MSQLRQYLLSLVFILMGLITLSPQGLALETTPLSGKAKNFTESLSLDQPPVLFSIPSSEGHDTFAKAMKETQKELRLYMFRLTEASMVKALIENKQRGLKVRVLVDQSMAKSTRSKATLQKLKDAGVELQTGSLRFTMTHAKTLIMDDDRALITTMNMTNTAGYSRGLGLDVHDQSVVKELIQTFDGDWRDALSKSVPVGPPNSKVKDSNLVWSPDNSEVRLMQMVADAEKSIEVMVENLGATPLMDSFVQAVQRGVKVRVLVPLCTTSPIPLHNWEYMQKLAKGGVEVRNMPIPYNWNNPYTHAKAMLIDQRLGYVGSINFSKNSLQKAREVGLVFDNEPSVGELERIWLADWAKAGPPPDSVSASTCPAELVGRAAE